MLLQLKLFLFLLFTNLVCANVITPLAPRATDSRCAADNCYRALSNRYVSTAEPFCSSYTTNPTATIPAYATSGCANNPSRVTSACSCLATEYYAPKPFHRVAGPADNQSYTYYDDAINIRSDDLPSCTWDECYANCKLLCNGCNTLSFGIAAYEQNGVSYRFYLCYVMKSPYDPAKLQYAANWTRNVVDARYT